MDKEFNFPRAKYGWKANAVLAAGFVLIVAGIFLMVKHSAHATKVFAFRPMVLLGIGVAALFVSIAFTESGNTLYVGLFCVMMGVVLLLIDTHTIRYSLKELWPTIMISSGLALFPASIYRLKRIRTVYLFPAIMLNSCLRLHSTDSCCFPCIFSRFRSGNLYRSGGPCSSLRVVFRLW